MRNWKGFVVRAVDNSNVVPLEYVGPRGAGAGHKIPCSTADRRRERRRRLTRYGSVDVALGWPLRYFPTHRGK